jgi:hypothetical protein
LLWCLPDPSSPGMMTITMSLEQLNELEASALWSCVSTVAQGELKAMRLILKTMDSKQTPALRTLRDKKGNPFEAHIDRLSYFVSEAESAGSSNAPALEVYGTEALDLKFAKLQKQIQDKVQIARDDIAVFEVFWHLLDQNCQALISVLLQELRDKRGFAAAQKAQERMLETQKKIRAEKKMKVAASVKKDEDKKAASRQVFRGAPGCKRKLDFISDEAPGGKETAVVVKDD